MGTNDNLTDQVMLKTLAEIMKYKFHEENGKWGFITAGGGVIWTEQSNPLNNHTKNAELVQTFLEKKPENFIIRWNVIRKHWEVWIMLYSMTAADICEKSTNCLHAICMAIYKAWK